MPGISYRDLLAGEATVDVVFNGHTISLTYDPSTITDTVFREIRDMARQSLNADVAGSALDPASDATTQVNQAIAAIDEILDLGATVNTLLRRFLLRWDLLDGDGGMFPITDERLPDLPLAFRQACLNALMSGGRMGEANGTTSPARSVASTSTGTRAGSRPSVGPSRNGSRSLPSAKGYRR